MTLSTLAQEIVLPDGKAKKLVENNCADCHGLDQVVNSPMSSADWRKTVKRMVNKGASLSPEEIDSVVDYLSVYFPLDKINVNTATAQQLQVVLQISTDDSEKIVKYRTANGNYKDFASLQKVTGIDQTKLAAKKEQLTF